MHFIIIILCGVQDAQKISGKFHCFLIKFLADLQFDKLRTVSQC